VLRLQLLLKIVIDKKYEPTQCGSQDQVAKNFSPLKIAFDGHVSAAHKSLEKVEQLRGPINYRAKCKQIHKNPCPLIIKLNWHHSHNSLIFKIIM